MTIIFRQQLCYQLIIIQSILFISHSQNFPYLNKNVCELIIKTGNSTVFSSCSIEEEWLDVYQYQTDRNFKEVYESPESIRRSFTIDYQKDSESSPKKNPIILSSISVSNTNPDYLKPIILSNTFPYTLHQGDSFDFIVEYNCKDMWDDVKITISINGEKDPINFFVKKICNRKYLYTSNFSYFVLLLFYIIFIHFSRVDFLIHKEHFVQINIKELIQAKNVENIFYTTIIIIGIIIFFISIGYIYIISFFFATLLSVICVKSFVKFIFSLLIPSIMDKFEAKSCYLLYFKFTGPKIFYYAIAIAIYVFWFICPFKLVKIILNNVIVFIVTYYTIHKINFRNFIMIATLFFLVILYQMILLITYDGLVTKNTNPTFDLTTHLIIDAPIRFVLPDLVSSPFDEIYFFSTIDLVLLGFLLRYLEGLSLVNERYLTIGLYNAYLGLMINLFVFYIFKIYPPLYFVPCMLVIAGLLIYAFIAGDFLKFWNLDKMKKLSKKELFDVPLGIIGADHSEDYANLSPEYIPPNVYIVGGEKRDEDGMNLEMNELTNNLNRYDFMSSLEASYDEKSPKENKETSGNENKNLNTRGKINSKEILKKTDNKTEMKEIKDNFSFKVQKDE